MEQVVLIVHLMLALAIIGLVLLQRSEGGGLGIGGSGGLGGLASPGGAASALSKVTSICAFCFFGTSLLLGILAGTHGNARSLLDGIDSVVPVETAAQPVTGDAVNAQVPVDGKDAADTASGAPEDATPAEGGPEVPLD